MAVSAGGSNATLATPGKPCKCSLQVSACLPSGRTGGKRTEHHQVVALRFPMEARRRNIANSDGNLMLPRIAMVCGYSYIPPDLLKGTTEGWLFAAAAARRHVTICDSDPAARRMI